MGLEFPQTVMYAKRVTMEYVEAQYNKEYGANYILGSLSSSGEWSPRSLTPITQALYDHVSRYYGNCVIGYDDIDYWIKRFNHIFDIHSARLLQLFSANGPQLGSKENMRRIVNDQNTLNNGTSEVYKRNGSNTVSSESTSKSQNAVTNREQSTGNTSGKTEYGEGYSLTRSRDGKTDERETTTEYEDTTVSSQDIQRFLASDVVSVWLDGFHELFMEVI